MKQASFYKTMFATLFLVFTIIGCKQECSYLITEKGVKLNLNHFIKEVVFYDSNTVRITVSKNDNISNDSGLVVVKKPQKVDFTVEDKNGSLFLKTTSLNLIIDKKTGAIVFNDKNSNVLISENYTVPHSFTDTILFDKRYYAVTQQFTISSNEGIYGLGQFQNGQMNYRNKEVLLVQANTIAIVPFLISTNNYGILWDNYSKTTFKNSANNMSFSSKVADKIDYYIIAGTSMDKVISGYRELTGNAPMFSKKAYGYWQCKERYVSFDDLQQTIKTFRENKIPLDNIVQDWQYWGNNDYWSSMVFEPVHFPSPKENIKKIHDLNVDLMVSIWPAVGAKTDIYKDLDTNGFLIDNFHFCGGKVYDAYNPEARKLYWNHIRKGLADNGVDAYWMDGTEVEFVGVDDQAMFESNILKSKIVAAGPIAKYLNTYSLVTTGGVYEGHRELTNEKRVFILTRSAWAGQQRNAAATWSGDISASFPVLKNQIAAGINISMAGIPYWTHDIGAFHVYSSGGLYPLGIEDKAYQELFVRWYQFGAFTPLFRSHGTNAPREPWQLKKRNFLFYNALVKSTELRYQLLEYIYSNAWKITNEGFTMMRGLMMDFPEDINTKNINDQYMFGNAFLVKPVTSPMYFEDIIGKMEKVDSKYLQTQTGNKGLEFTLFTDTAFQEIDKSILIDPLVVDKKNWVNIKPDKTLSIKCKGNMVAPESGEYTLIINGGGYFNFYIDNKLIVTSQKRTWEPSYYQTNIYLEKGKKYSLKADFKKPIHWAGIYFELNWVLPGKTNNIIESDKMVSVYLPEHIGWYDYWTNQFHAGGRTIKKECPIDIFPLYVKAGSIIPFVPVQQYVGENPDAPIEIRIYTGLDANFDYYEDEGDNYNYEQGKYNLISFKWDNKNKILAIGDSKGQYEGMKKEKVFRISVVTKNGYREIKQIKYNGNNLIVPINFE